MSLSRISLALGSYARQELIFVAKFAIVDMCGWCVVGVRLLMFLGRMLRMSLTRLWRMSSLQRLLRMLATSRMRSGFGLRARRRRMMFRHAERAWTSAIWVWSRHPVLPVGHRLRHVRHGQRFRLRLRSVLLRCGLVCQWRRFVSVINQRTMTRVRTHSQIIGSRTHIVSRFKSTYVSGAMGLLVRWPLVTTVWLRCSASMSRSGLSMRLGLGFIRVGTMVSITIKSRRFELRLVILVL